ncbi:septum formation family protein, partial [Frigoribacterium sp. MCBA15_019]|uniref:septum formation family protein n=1 Tax=Frigoribacterium sp. MCBA15_019 TaxID=1898745 RepID=UPI001C435EBE
ESQVEPRPESEIAPQSEAGPDPEPEPGLHAPEQASATSGVTTEPGAEAPWWVEEHHEMTRRERRLAEAAAAAAAAAANGAAPAGPAGAGAGAGAASAPVVGTPSVSRPGGEPETDPSTDADREPTFTEILGVVSSAPAGGDDPQPQHAAPVTPAPAAWSLSESGAVPEVVTDVDPGAEPARAGVVDDADRDVDDEGIDDDDEVTTATALFAPPRSALDTDTDTDTDTATDDGTSAATGATAVLPGLSATVAGSETTGSGSRAAAGPVGERPRGGAGTAGVFVPQTRPVEPAPAGSPRGPGIADWVRGHKVLAAVGAALVIVLLLVALFFIARSLFASTDDLASDPAAATSPTAARTVTAAPVEPVAEVAPAGPLAPGVHSYADLQGGECFSTFESAWQQDYDVADCGQPHVAQLTRVGTLDGDATAAYPGADVLQSQMNLLCTGADALDRQAAAAYPDVQLLASFPADADAWAAGDRTYSCFVNRSSGEPLTTSLVAVAG